MTYPQLLLGAHLVWLVAIAIVDIRTHRAPNRVVYPSILLALAATLALAPSDALEAVAGGLLAFALLALIVIIGGGRMGAGDAKVGAMAGLAVGVGGVPTLLATAFVGGAAFAVVMIGLRLRARTDVVAFTPMLLAGVLAAILTGPSYLLR